MVGRSALLRTTAAGALLAAAALASAPAQAQFVCTTTGIDQSCSNTGTQVGSFSTNDPNAGSTVTVTNTSTGTVAGGGTVASSAAAGGNAINTNAGTIAQILKAFTAGGGNASVNNSGTINGTGPDLLNNSAAIQVFTQFGGNATAINSGSLTTSGITVYSQNRTPGPNGDATGTNTASGAVATLFLVEAGAGGAGTGGNATGTNAGSVGQYFQVDTRTGGNATGISSGSVGQFFQVSTDTGGNATGTNSGSIAQYFNVLTGVTTGTGNATGTNSGTVAGEFLVGAGWAGFGMGSGGNATGTNSGTVGLDFTVASHGGIGGNVSATNSGTIGTNFSVSTTGGNVTAANSGTVGGSFQVNGSSGGGFNVTAVNSGSVGTNFIVLNSSAGGVTTANSGTVGGGFSVTAGGGNVTAINSGRVGQAFNVSLSGGAGSVTATNSGSVGSFSANTALAVLPANATATNSGTIGTAGVFSQGFVIAANPGGNATGTNSGTVNGSVHVTNGLLVGSGSSSFTNSGTINNPTGTAITFSAGAGSLNANNTLTLLQGSSVAGNIVLGAGGNNVVNVDAGGPIAGNIVGAGAGNTLNFAVGPGTFIYGSAFGFSVIDQVNLSSGTVILNGTNAATNIAVTGGNLQVGDAANSAARLTGSVNVTGGTLSGHGTVVGNVSVGNGATLAPGGSVGTLTIQGNLVLASAVSYMVDVSSVTSSRTAVTGTATLGGIVGVMSSANSFRFNSPYTILTSAGLGGTRFNGFAPLTGLTGSLSYTATDVQFTLTSAIGQFGGLNANQRAVATTLDAVFNASGNSGTVGGIFNGNIMQNLTQATGEIATGSQQTTFDAMNLFMGAMTDPFIGGRGDSVTSPSGVATFAEENGGASAYAASGKARSQSERDAYAAVYRKAPVAANADAQRWSVWAAGFGGSQTTNGNAAVGSNTATSRIYGTAVGADYRLSPFTIAGFALAGGGTNFSIANALGTGRSDLFQAGAYVRHVVGPAYLSAALAYGWQDVTTDRTVTIAGIDHLSAEFNANAFSGRAEGGYRFATPWMGVTPYAAGQFTTFDLPAYAEGTISGSNAFALAYNARSVTDTRSELGLRTDRSFALSTGILTLRSRFAWAHDFDPNRSIAATFQGLPGSSFVVNGAAQAQDSALTTVAAEMKWMNGWSAAATFEGGFSDVTRSYAGKGVVRYQW